MSALRIFWSSENFSFSWDIFFRRCLQLMHCTTGLGCQTGQCDPSELLPYNEDEKDLLQLQFHHTGTAFWTWSRHSMRCHCRGPRGTVRTWGQESRSCLGAYQQKQQRLSARSGFFLTSLLSPPLTSVPQIPPPHSLCLSCWKQQEQTWTCPNCELFYQRLLLLCH